MTDHTQETVAELVLIAFQSACPQASEADVHEWSTRYPAHAENISAFAQAVRECAAMTDATSDQSLSAEELNGLKAAARAFASGQRQAEATIAERTARKASADPLQIVRPRGYER